MTDVVINESKLGIVEGKVAIVTGGASGIGRAIAEILARRGAVVVICDINDTAGDEVGRAIGKNVDFVKANVTIWEELRAVFAFAYKKHGCVNMVFANAGVVQSLDVWQDEFDEQGELLSPDFLTIDVTLKSVILTAKLAMSYFRRNNPCGGSLLFTCSSSSYNERPNLPLYSIAKHGVLGLMRSLRVLAPQEGVNVAAIAPGATATGMVGPPLQEKMKAYGIDVQSAEFVALAALILASNKELNGQCYVVQGGKGTEVEVPLKNLQPSWYGEYNTLQANKVTAVVVPPKST